MVELIAKVTVVLGLHPKTKQPIEVAPGAAFNVKATAEAEHLVAIGAAEYAVAAAEPAPSEGGEGGGA